MAKATHSVYYMNFLARREEDVKGRRQIDALREINDDFENIRKGWLWSLEHKRFDAIGGALECLAIVGESSGRLLEARAILQQSAENPDIQQNAANPDSQTSAGVTGAHGQILWERIVVRLARLDVALRNEVDLGVIEGILARARKRDDGREIAWCLWVIAEREAIVSGRDWQARLLYEELIALCERTGTDYFRAHALTNIAWRYANHGELERAIAALRESIAIRKKIGALKNLDFPASQLGWLIFDQLQDIEGGEALLDEQIALQNQSGTTSVLTLILGMKALMAFWQNDVDATLKLAHRGIEIARNQNYLGGLSVCQGALGLVEIRSGDYHQARLICQEVDRTGFSSMTAFPAHWVLSFASYALGDEADSRERLKKTMQIACRYKSPTFQGMGLLLFILLELGKSEPQRAVEYLAFCFSQPPHLTKWLHGWSLLDDLAAKLQAQLGPETYSAAWVRGQTLDLNQEAAKQLSDLQ
jgi:tetratricopeptide (TPR) repeat protein